MTVIENLDTRTQLYMRIFLLNTMTHIVKSFKEPESGVNRIHICLGSCLFPIRCVPYELGTNPGGI